MKDLRSIKVVEAIERVRGVCRRRLSKIYPASVVSRAAAGCNAISWLLGHLNVENVSSDRAACLVVLSPFCVAVAE